VPVPATWRRKQDVGSTQRDERAVSAYVERLGDALTDAGMPRLASRVFAQILADEEGRMTAAELSRALAVSPAAISGAVRYLTHTQLIGKERAQGSRRDVYVVQVDAWHGALMSRDRVMRAMLSGTRAGVDAVGGEATAAGRRLQLSVEMLQFLMDKLATLTDEWHARRAEIMAAWPTDD
jgi:DNA-binding transcriptional regulator GbsR (MarR family)